MRTNQGACPTRPLRPLAARILAEYEMKWATIEPSQAVFDFTPGDRW